ncbi:AzlC family ABC transporter permease [Floricoccus penangensis]|uniref:AzlC family ABC transporter permease n=1 Tax=Floricoccus penangensis TaxID=1859475 RepID=UPI00203D0A4D|nr:AzlC family ABC transporter permease [Floricoccus penangensis]URZ86892.1 AzlC family ABC transporter permease [Floricoccus penangensis]
MNNNLDYKTGIKDTLPTVFGFIGIAMAFGVIGKSAGLSTFLVGLMSILVYAGSAQFITVSMLAAASPILPIILSTFLVNSRMILMSMTLAPYFKNESLGKNILLGSLLTDESFGLAVNKLNFTNDKLSFSWLNASNTVAYLTWVISSILGAILGNFISDPKKFGLDFALVAMFIGLLYLQVLYDKGLDKTLQLIVIAITLALTYLGLIFLPTNLLIIVVTITTCGIGVLIKNAFF